MHKKPLTELERQGLRLHGLDIGTPSQLSDCFRLGVAWASEQLEQKLAEAEKQNEWVSVEDRLPEYGTPCLVWMEAHRSAITCNYFDDFGLVRSSSKDGLAPHGVTHWKPILPPQEKE